MLRALLCADCCSSERWRSLRAVVDLNALGPRSIHLDCDVLQADGGTRTASITGAFVALALALETLRSRDVLRSIPLNDSVAAISVGIVDGEALLTLAPMKGDAGGHGHVPGVDEYLNLGPDFRFAPPGTQEAWKELEVEAGEHDAPRIGGGPVRPPTTSRTPPRLA